MLVPNKDLPGYKEHVIYFIVFAFGEGVEIIHWLSRMKLYVSNTVEFYRYTIIGHLGNSGIAYLLLHIVQCWIACAIDKYNKSLHNVL